MSCGLARRALTSTGGTPTAGTAGTAGGAGTGAGAAGTVGATTHAAEITLAGSGSVGTSRRGLDSKSKVRPMLEAYLSRVVSGGRPNRYSISLRIDSKPETWWLTWWRRAHG